MNVYPLTIKIFTEVEVRGVTCSDVGETIGGGGVIPQGNELSPSLSFLVFPQQRSFLIRSHYDGKSYNQKWMPSFVKGGTKGTDWVKRVDMKAINTIWLKQFEDFVGDLVSSLSYLTL